MIFFKVEYVFIFAISFLKPLIVNGLFEQGDKTLSVFPNSSFPLVNFPYRKRTKSSTRVVLVGQPGERLQLVCDIRFSRRCSKSNRRRRSSRRCQCSDDYFYIGFDLDPQIRGARYYCGKRTIRKSSRLTSGQPVLVVGK